MTINNVISFNGIAICFLALKCHCSHNGEAGPSCNEDFTCTEENGLCYAKRLRDDNVI